MGKFAWKRAGVALLPDKRSDAERMRTRTRTHHLRRPVCPDCAKEGANSKTQTEAWCEGLCKKHARKHGLTPPPKKACKGKKRAAKKKLRKRKIERPKRKSVPKPTLAVKKKLRNKITKGVENQMPGKRSASASSTKRGQDFLANFFPVSAEGDVPPKETTSETTSKGNSATASVSSVEARAARLEELMGSWESTDTEEQEDKHQEVHQEVCQAFPTPEQACGEKGKEKLPWYDACTTSEEIQLDEFLDEGLQMHDAPFARQSYVFLGAACAGHSLHNLEEGRAIYLPHRRTGLPFTTVSSDMCDLLAENLRKARGKLLTLRCRRMTPGLAYEEAGEEEDGEDDDDDEEESAYLSAAYCSDGSINGPG